MISAHDEVEVKYDVALDADVPTLSSLLAEVPGAAEAGLREGDLGEHELQAVYFDTADLRLSAAKIALRRRTGGTDAGWHLKTPGADGARLEQRVPLGRAVRTVPAALRRLVAEHTDGAALVPVAQLNTRRHVRTVLDATGRRVLELADDVVEARRLLPLAGSGEAAGAVQRWREVELELLEGDRATFEALDDALRAAGLSVSASPSKVGRLLSGAGSAATATDTRAVGGPADGPGDDAAQEPSGSEPVEAREPGPGRAFAAVELPRRTELKRHSAAGDVLLVHLHEQVEQVLTQDPRVRRDEPEAVHKMRGGPRRGGGGGGGGGGRGGGARAPRARAAPPPA
uniref:CYTH domain-containing protein n=1 Tax=Kineococcus sp. SYSU DK030 TaxID=3383151 RepID=UPI003D7DBE01